MKKRTRLSIKILRDLSLQWGIGAKDSYDKQTWSREFLNYVETELKMPRPTPLNLKSLPAVSARPKQADEVIFAQRKRGVSPAAPRSPNK